MILPDSMYTPEKYKSSSVSAYPSLGSSRTPKCQSAPLLLVLALMGDTSSTRSSLPVECQNPTVAALKSISYEATVSFPPRSLAGKVLQIHKGEAPRCL